MEFTYLALQSFKLPPLDFSYLGTRGLAGVIMLIHIFFATLFVGYAVGSPILQAWGKRTGNAKMERLSYSIAHFNVLTFSLGATFAAFFLVILMGFYPRVTTTLFTHFFWFFPVLGMTVMVLTLYFFYIHFYRGRRQNILAGFAAAFFILVWQAILTGIDTYMVTGGGNGGQAAVRGGSDLASAFGSILNPAFIPLDLHRTFGNLSWPAFAVAAWAGFSYRRAKSAEDKEFFDWAGSTGMIWGTIFLMLQPFAGFLIAYSLKGLYTPGELSAPGASGSYDRLVGTGPGATFTSHLLLINTILVVGLFVLVNTAMYLGAGRHPDRRGRTPIRFFGLIAALAGLYAISPLANWPFFLMRYVMLALMVLATVGALISYLRGRRQFRYGSPGNAYRVVLISLGVLAAVTMMGMGFMKSNSRAPYTIYGQPNYKVSSESPVTPNLLNKQRP